MYLVNCTIKYNKPFAISVLLTFTDDSTNINNSGNIVTSCHPFGFQRANVAFGHDVSPCPHPHLLKAISIGKVHFQGSSHGD